MNQLTSQPINFTKYHGSGNDFILIDNRAGTVRLDTATIARLCHRRFGIGADGLMLLEPASGADFQMVYYNADGNESSMCGNGGRCITAFARRLGLIDRSTRFTAVDGLHEAQVNPDDTISLKMQDVDAIKRFADHCELDTGSPHYVLWVDAVEKADVFHRGREIRNSAPFTPAGINVNFVQRLGEDALWVRTYERGVEDETYSCGTGVTAAAIAATNTRTGSFKVAIRTPGGALQVSFTKDTADTAKEVILTGPAVFVFEGTVTL